ncbi:IclR family transcriptional regulator [Mesorhizobium sp. PUT5]|uniref:IclR family transcriptional regulator n=1 Tax=Mesorhizobium sp. PUT5 TaxID=3454629 RepID=UPI003FA48DB1
MAGRKAKLASEADGTGTDRAGTERDDRYRAPALDKGLDIIELLSAQPGGLTRAEIAKAMERRPSEVYRMLERLVARDYVTRSREGDRYALSMKLFVLAHRHPPVRRLVQRALPLMDAFAQQAGQSCHLVVPDRDAATVVAHASSPGNWEFGIRVGAHIDLLTTGSGQTLLAFQGENARADTLARWTGSGESKAYERLGPVLEGYRAAGHRIGPSQQIRGVDDITVPILSPDGHAVAVLTCAYIERLDDEQIDIQQALALLQGIAGKLSLS